MNPDDPKLTAYALDELDPAERAEVEQLLRENPGALAEVEDTERLAAQLRRELHAEPAAPLTAEQRTEVLITAEATVHSAKVVSMPSRWSRPLALAASVAVLCGAAYIALQSLQQSVERPVALSRREVRSAPILPEAPASAPAPAERDWLAKLPALAASTDAPAPANQAPTGLGEVAAVDVSGFERTNPEMTVLAGAAQPDAGEVTVSVGKRIESEVAAVTKESKPVPTPIAPASPRFESLLGLTPAGSAESKSEPHPNLAPAKPATAQPSAGLAESKTLGTSSGVTVAGRVTMDALSSTDGTAAADATRATLAPDGKMPSYRGRGIENPLANAPVDLSEASARGGVALGDEAKEFDELAEVSSRSRIVDRMVRLELADGGDKAQPEPELANPTAGGAPAAGNGAAKPAIEEIAKSGAGTLSARPLSASPVAAEHTARGISLYSQAKYDDAVSELTKALAADPKNATARNYLGITASQKGWQEAAVKELEAAVATDPAYADAHFNLAVVLATQQPPHNARARLYYRQAIEHGAERDENLEKMLAQREPSNTESYDAITDNLFLAVRDNPLSTFSIDVDTASYANVRRFLNEQRLPPKGAVRIEEMLNYFDYDYPQPDGDAPFSASMEVAACPWTPEHRLVRVGLKGREIHPDKRPATNLVFLVDVSGSMQPENKLPLVKKCLRQLVDRLGGEDTVAIAVYAGASGCVLEPTNKKSEMRAALDRLESGGSTNGAAGIQLAYQLAERSFIKGGVNRVILATDGDFNVGVTNQSDLVDLIEKKAKSGVFLTVLGFGMGNLKDSTLEKLADKGNGNYAYIDTFNEGRKVLVDQMSGTLVTIAKDVKIQVEFNPAQVGSYRLIGYENRMLKKEDFNDDSKDAGEIGAGHTVTALYEVVPAGAKPATPAVDALKYQPTPAQPAARLGDTKRYVSPGVDPAVASEELLTLKLRYKAPDGDTSKLLEFPLTDDGKSYERSSRDFRFAAAVASFGMLLRDSPHKGKANWSSTLELAIEGKGEDRSGYRAEFVGLIERAKAASR